MEQANDQSQRSASRLREVVWISALTYLFHLLLSLPERLAEHAVFGWMNERIASVLGITNPTPKEVLNFFVRWGIPAMASFICVSGWLYALNSKRGGSTSGESEYSKSIAGNMEAANASKIRDSEIVSPASANVATVTRLKHLISDGERLLSLYRASGDRFARGEFIAWLTEAHQLTNSLTGSEWSSYRDQLVVAIGPELSKGDLYQKSDAVFHIMKSLLKARQLD